MSTNKYNLKNIDNNNAFVRMYKQLLLYAIENPTFPLWWKIYNYLLLDVKFEEGYISCSINKELSRYFKTDIRNIRSSISRLVGEGLLLKYPYGYKRAKGYVINPEFSWFGGDESRNKKLNIYYTTMNKLIVEVDPDYIDEVTVKVINKNNATTNNITTTSTSN